jgi:sporulation protein YlmC with PRC-barrel domain
VNKRLLLTTALLSITAVSTTVVAQSQQPNIPPQTPGITAPPAESAPKKPDGSTLGQSQGDRSASPGTTAADQPARQMPGQVLASKLMGASIQGANNEKLGTINDVLIDESGKVVAVIVGVGGFLGIGEKNVAIPYGDVTRSGSSGSPLATKLSKADLENAPVRTPAPSSSGSGDGGTTRK